MSDMNSTNDTNNEKSRTEMQKEHLDELRNDGAEVIEFATGLNMKSEIAQIIAELEPTLISENGKLDKEKLIALLENDIHANRNKGYGLNWVGKDFAKAKVQEHISKELEFVLEQSKGEDTENLVIRGDNLDALKLLLNSYRGKVKCIYIDPPYNTKDDIFIYSDDFRKHEKELLDTLKFNNGDIDELDGIYKSGGHSGWLTFMHPRLMLAREFLTEDGVIFVSIDDNEQAQLKLLMDEIFQENNLAGILKWKRKKQPSFRSNHIISITEYILVYAKSKNLLNKLSIDKINGDTKPLINSSNPITERTLPAGIPVNADKNKIDAGEYKIRTSIITYLNDVIIENGKTTSPVKIKARFRDSQSNINKYAEQGLIFITSNIALRRSITEEEMDKDKAITDLLLDWGQNQDAFDELYKIFECEIFKTAKPTILVKNILKASLDNNDLVMDFFAGSGTTGDAVMQLNKEDGGNRKFILIQWDEKIKQDKIKRRTEISGGGGGWNPTPQHLRQIRRTISA